MNQFDNLSIDLQKMWLGCACDKNIVYFANNIEKLTNLVSKLEGLTLYSELNNDSKNYLDSIGLREVTNNLFIFYNNFDFNISQAYPLKNNLPYRTLPYYEQANKYVALGMIK